jgi:PAS domain S-box-containing protein
MTRIGPYTVDWKSGELQGASGNVHLSPVLVSVLRLIVGARGKVVTKERFHKEIWSGQAVEDGNLSQAVFLLRKALGKLPDGSEVIETVSKRGYRLAAQACDSSMPNSSESVGISRQFGIAGEEPYRLLIEAIDDWAIYMLDVSGRVLTWNKGAERNEGFVSAEVIGQHYSMFFVPEDVSMYLPERHMAMAATHGQCNGEGWRLRKNGERFWAGFTLTALPSRNRNLLGFATVVRDLSERKRQEDVAARMEAELRRERDRLRSAAENSLDALFICDALKDQQGEIEDFIFTYLNRRAESLVEIPGEELRGGRMSRLLPVNLQAGLFEACKRVALTGEPLRAVIEMTELSWKTNWVRIQAVRLDEGIAVTASDVGEQKSILTHRLGAD